MSKRGRRQRPMIEVRHSPVHGYGVFALRRIRKGTTVIEYLGDRISHEEADARYDGKHPQDNHTFLFTVDAKTVIDAGANGNEARYINHGCDPNCQSTTAGKRIFIEAIRTIQPGEELAYDYQIQRDADDAPDIDADLRLPLRRAELPRQHAGGAAQTAKRKAAKRSTALRKTARHKTALRKTALRKTALRKTALRRGG